MSSKATYRERLIAGLTAMGFCPVTGERSHYEAFQHLGKGERKLFVGANGALRSGECASRSHSIGDASHQTAFYAAVLAKGDIALAQQRLAPTKPSVDYE